MYKTYEYECRVYKEYMWKDIEENRCLCLLSGIKKKLRITLSFLFSTFLYVFKLYIVLYFFLKIIIIRF